MLKKIIRITIPIIMILIIIAIGYNTYQKALENSKNPLTIIPRNASIILQCNLYSSKNKNMEKIIKYQ